MRSPAHHLAGGSDHCATHQSPLTPPLPPGEAETETPGQWTWWGRMAIEHVGHVAGERRDNILVLSNRI